MKTTLEIPDRIFRRAKAMAALRGQSFKDLVTAGIEHELAEATTHPAGSMEAWLKDYEALGRQIETAWKSDKTVVELLSDIRR